MSMMGRGRACGVGLGVMLFAGAAQAASPLPVELNKLEAIPGGAPGCRAYIVATNPDPDPIDQLRLDLVLFGTDGVIASRIALDLGPLAPNKVGVRLFDLQGLACNGIGRMLVNDVLLCQTGRPAADQDRDACLERIAPTSRTSVPLVK